MPILLHAVEEKQMTDACPWAHRSLFFCSLVSLLFLTQLGQDAASALGVQEGNLQAVGTIAGSLVDKAYAIGVTLSQSFCYTILNLEGNVMNATATIVKELLYGTLGTCWLEQLNLHFANLEESGLYLLVLNNLFLVELQTENVGIVGENLSNVLDSNAQMFNS
jgi:hypothetical protein